MQKKQPTTCSICLEAHDIQLRFHLSALQAYMAEYKQQQRLNYESAGYRTIIGKSAAACTMVIS
jgi:hypothetical protein